MQFRSDDEPLLPKHVAVKLLQYSSVDRLYFLTLYLNICNSVIEQCTSTAVHCIQQLSGRSVGWHRMPWIAAEFPPAPDVTLLRLPEWQLLK